MKGNTCKTEHSIPFPSLVSVPIFSFSENGTIIHNTFDSSFTLHFPSFPTFNSSSYPIGSTFRNVLHLFLFSIYVATICVQATIIFLLHYCSSLLTGLHSYLIFNRFSHTAKMTFLKAQTRKCRFLLKVLQRLYITLPPLMWMACFHLESLRSKPAS